MKSRAFTVIMMFLVFFLLGGCSATRVDTTQFSDDPKAIVQECLDKNGTIALKNDLREKGFNLQKAIWNINGNVSQSFSGDFSFYDARGSVEVAASKNGEGGLIIWGFKAKVQKNAQGKTKIVDLDVS
jgi:hypothetical protein